MIRLSVLILAAAFSSLLRADEFDLCNDMVIDDVTEEAFGPHGAPYSGEVVCYWDADKSMIRYRRIFDHGKPIGRHVCYTKSGEMSWYIRYEQTSKKKRGAKMANQNFSPFVRKALEEHLDCGGSPEVCWFVEVCDERNGDCVFKCD